MPYYAHLQLLQEGLRCFFSARRALVSVRSLSRAKQQQARVLQVACTANSSLSCFALLRPVRSTTECTAPAQRSSFSGEHTASPPSPSAVEGKRLHLPRCAQHARILMTSAGMCAGSGSLVERHLQAYSSDICVCVVRREHQCYRCGGYEALQKCLADVQCSRGVVTDKGDCIMSADRLSKLFPGHS
jgi:hypothetical protein